MPVVAVINRKGGSGKSTLATHLAAWCARQGWGVMLGDVDRQQSSLTWLRRRARQPQADAAAIVGWAMDGKRVMRPPAGISHVVLDTPGGLRGPELARLVMHADAIVLPVCVSAFDRESAAACHAELLTLPRVASGRCQVAAVGMRVDARTKGGEQLQAWAAALDLKYLGAIRETQAYVRSAEQGLTLFDQAPHKVEADLAQWLPITDWLQASWQPAGSALPLAPPPAEAGPMASAARSLVRMPGQHLGQNPVHKPTPVVLAGSRAGEAGRALVERAMAALPQAPRSPVLQGAMPADKPPLATLPEKTGPRPRRSGRLDWLFDVFKSPG